MANQLPKDVGENVERNYETHLASLGLDLSDSDDDLICYETMTESDEEENALWYPISITSLLPRYHRAISALSRGM